MGEGSEMKMRYTLSSIYGLIAIAILTSCSGGQHRSAREDGDTLHFKYAEHLTVVQFDNYTQVELADPWNLGKTLHTYLLVPANEKYDAIMLTENMDVRFVGRMLWNMRRDVHDTTRNIRQSIERYLNKYGEPIVQEPVQQVAKIEETPRQLPPELNSRKAQRILNRAVDAQLLTADYQRPKGVEWWRMACMADAIGEELALTNKWVVFCTLWGNSNLRKYNTDKQGMTDYNNFRKILMKQII